VWGSLAHSVTEGAAGVSKKSRAGYNRGIPPFKKRRVGHPPFKSDISALA
jgi:hypothetical protein